jgi:hypothetical protein
MPKISNVVVKQKRDDGSYDVTASPPEFVKKKFALFLKALAKKDIAWDREKAFESVGILPGQFHRWIKKYPELRKRLEICEEGVKDWGEKRLRDFMAQDNKVGMVATIFYLKTKAQDRGYSEQIQFTGTVENKYPKEMLEAVTNAAKSGNSRPMINVTPNSKRLTSGEDD